MFCFINIVEVMWRSVFLCEQKRFSSDLKFFFLQNLRLNVAEKRIFDLALLPSFYTFFSLFKKIGLIKKTSL